MLICLRRWSVSWVTCACSAIAQAKSPLSVNFLWGSWADYTPPCKSLFYVNVTYELRATYFVFHRLWYYCLYWKLIFISQHSDLVLRHICLAQVLVLPQKSMIIIIYNTNHSATLIFHSGEKNLLMSHGKCQLRMSHANSYARAGKSQATVLTNLTNVTLNLTNKWYLFAQKDGKTNLFPLKA